MILKQYALFGSSIVGVYGLVGISDTTGRTYAQYFVCYTSLVMEPRAALYTCSFWFRVPKATFGRRKRLVESSHYMDTPFVL
jgi:hypothetical protein